MEEDIGFKRKKFPENCDYRVKFWESEVENVMSTIKNVSGILSNAGKLNETFELVEEGCSNKIKEKQEVNSWLEEIAKMDAVLRAKGNEEKKARLSRIQSQEEAREILSQVLASQTSTFKENLEEFLKVLTRADTAVTESLTAQGEEKEKSEGEKHEKPRGNEEQKKAKNLRFVERNIELAKCGRGVLSLTNEEKSRIETVLGECMEDEEASEESGSCVRESKREMYGASDEMRAKLAEIDEKLEALTGGRAHLPVKGKTGEAEEKQKENGSQLSEIDKLLSAINSASSEEINPLTEEELQTLIETSKKHLNGGTECPNFALPDRTLADLLSKAKFLMPKFKYKYAENA